MSHSDPERNEAGDIWNAFDKAVERAEEYLDRAWENYDVVQRTDEPLPEEYVTALSELNEAIEGFDTVYKVTDEELERAIEVATNVEVLATVTGKYREYNELVTARRVRIVQEWFDALSEAVEGINVDLAANRSTLSREMQALQKFTDAGKYWQLLDSERIDLSDIESRVHKFDEAVRDAAPPNVYVATGIELAESFQEQYTNDLSELVQEGVDRDAISIAEHVEDVPELDSAATRLENGDVTENEISNVARAVKTYAEVSRLTGKRRKRYELGENLITAIEDSGLAEDANVEKDLRLRLSSFQLEPIERVVKKLVEVGAKTSDKERFRNVLSKYDGSVRRTAQALDYPSEELFEVLHELFVEEKIRDLEARFE